MLKFGPQIYTGRGRRYRLLDGTPTDGGGDGGGGGTPPPSTGDTTLSYAVRSGEVVTDEEILWRDRVYDAFATQTLSNYPAVSGDDMRRHNNIRDPLVHAASALASTGQVEFLEFVDQVGEELWHTLDYGYRGVDTLSQWTTGDHILDGDAVIDTSKLLIFVYRQNGSSDFVDNVDVKGTDLDYAHDDGRWMYFTTLLMEIYRQNQDVPLPASAQYDRTSKETQLAPDGAQGCANVRETTYGHRYEKWKWYNLHHSVPKWNRMIQRYEPWAPAGWALDDPYGYHYMLGWDKSSYHADGGDAMAINYYLWKATGIQKYEDAAKELTDFYMDVWAQPLTTDLGRPGIIMPRLLRARNSHHIGYNDGSCWSGYQRPTDYYREDLARLSHMQLTGWYRFADSSFVRRVHHNMADHVFADSVTNANGGATFGGGIPTSNAWVFGTDTGGHATRRTGWVRPDTGEVLTLESAQDNVNENVCQNFPPQGLSRIDGSPYFAVLPWHERGGQHDNRMKDIAEGVYEYNHGTGTPEYVGAATALLMNATLERKRSEVTTTQYPMTVRAQDPDITQNQLDRLADAKLWLDEVIAGTESLRIRTWSGNDNTRNAAKYGHGLFMLGFALAFTGDVDFFNEFDVNMDRMRDNLAVGFRGTDTNPDWNDGQHDVNNTDLLILVNKSSQNGEKSRGTDIWFSTDQRSAANAAFAAYVYAQNPDQPVQQWDRTTLECGSPNGPTIDDKIETTGADKAEFWLHWLQNHWEWKWRNRTIEDEMFRGGTVGVTFPWYNEKAIDGATEYAITILNTLGTLSGNQAYLDERDLIINEQQYGDFTRFGFAPPPHPWFIELTSDFGRPAYTITRYRPGDSFAQYHEPLHYAAEILRNWLFHWLIGLGNANDENMGRFAHMLADHAFDQTVSEAGGWFSWHGGADVGGFRTDRGGLPHSPTYTSDPNYIGQTFDRYHRNNCFNNFYPCMVAFDDNTNDRFRNLLTEAEVGYGSTKYEEGALIVGRLLDAFKNDL